jgi:hypothetical protein
MAAFQFYLQSGIQRKVGCVRTTVILFLVNIAGEKGSVRLCVVVMQQSVHLSPNFGAKCSHIFTQSPQNVTIVCGIDCLACQDKFFVNNSLDAKEKDENALDFALHLFGLLRSR